MGWVIFKYFAISASILWLISGSYILCKKKESILPVIAYSFGILIYLTFIVIFWIDIERAPMRTMGETRLLYSLFLSVVGLLIYLKWKFRWILIYTAILSTVFIMVNILKPEIHDITLPPALQSAWFVPHVISYMISYAILGVSTIISIYSLTNLGVEKRVELAKVNDSLINIGVGLITIGMLLGAFWAKQAWGDYWTWDPKETWAAVTWVSYITYIHSRRAYPRNHVGNAIILIISFIFLQICWYGINYLPAASSSIHSY